MVRSPLRATRKEGYGRHCQSSPSRKRGRHEEDDGSCTPPPSSSSHGGSRRTRGRLRSPISGIRDQLHSHSSSSLECHHRNLSHRGGRHGARSELADDARHHRKHNDIRRCDQQHRRHETADCAQGSCNSHHSSPSPLDDSFPSPPELIAAPPPTSTGLIPATDLPAGVPPSAAEVQSYHRLPEVPVASPQPPMVRIEALDERKQLLHTRSCSAPLRMPAPEGAEGRSRTIVANTTATGVLSTDCVQGAPFLKAPPPQSAALRPLTPAVLPVAGAPPPPPLSVSETVPFSEEEYFAWLCAPASSTGNRTSANMPLEATAASHRFACTERVHQHSVRKRQHEPDGNIVAEASTQPHHTSSATTVVQDNAAPPLEQGLEGASTAAASGPGEISYNHSFSVLTSWDALMAAPPLLSTTPRMPSLSTYHGDGMRKTAMCLARSTSPTHTCMHNDGARAPLTGSPDEPVAITSLATSPPRERSKGNESSWQKSLHDVEEDCTRTFVRHFVNGLVFVDPPWFICPALLDNCEHPYYMTWLDALEVGTVAEAVAEAKAKLLTDA
ncbi:hypothetical protein JKF63_02894 [Porcisia hertigi]|uniref:Uncharacterized protein n=1 Tax=Porcisia hertigi TaxID=2761500 RepID=A0A836LFV3_9TRYP|nr:hypothetical protein JKF63_02894 [Porcisia hertigi]